MFFCHFKGLKIPRSRERAGSSPATSTIVKAEQVEKKLSEKFNGECGQKEEASSQEEYLIKLFRKLNPQLKKNVISIKRPFP